MGDEWFKSCRPKDYYDQFLIEGIYPDGRSTSAFNPLLFKGGVAVSCTVQASLALCHDGPLISCEVDACASVSQADISDVTDMINQLFNNDALSTRTALLVKGVDNEMSMTWELTLQMQILNSDGPILDAIVCAASAALADVRLPTVKLDHAKEDESPIQQEEISVLDEVSPLRLAASPVAITFFVFQSASKDFVLVDPPQDLVEHCAARISMVTDGKNILMMRTRGMLTNENLLSSVSTMAERRHRTVMETMRAAVAQ
ncbi:unnamed protein product [Nippostrongylus brasiliensis]|uniref:Ribosomal RNA-processing protein 43 n=1 Tax=Nippostrongylus brasiliensis TaxID=27835 RepID=A0A0N4YQQ8_NIPBR|nr:unnamed protein product [Nippostrongylus brasiliensis]